MFSCTLLEDNAAKMNSAQLMSASIGCRVSGPQFNTLNIKSNWREETEEKLFKNNKKTDVTLLMF